MLGAACVRGCRVGLNAPVMAVVLAARGRRDRGGRHRRAEWQPGEAAGKAASPNAGIRRPCRRRIAFAGAAGTRSAGRPSVGHAARAHHPWRDLRADRPPRRPSARPARYRWRVPRRRALSSARAGRPPRRQRQRRRQLQPRRADCDRQLAEGGDRSAAPVPERTSFKPTAKDLRSDLMGAAGTTRRERHLPHRQPACGPARWHPGTGAYLIVSPVSHIPDSTRRGRAEILGWTSGHEVAAGPQPRRVAGSSDRGDLSLRLVHLLDRPRRARRPRAARRPARRPRTRFAPTRSLNEPVQVTLRTQSHDSCSAAYLVDPCYRAEIVFKAPYAVTSAGSEYLSARQIELQARPRQRLVDHPRHQTGRNGTHPIDGAVQLHLRQVHGAIRPHHRRTGAVRRPVHNRRNRDRTPIYRRLARPSLGVS